MARLLPVVAEQARAAELRRRHLGLARPVRTHERDVLSRPERARRVEDLASGRHRDHDVARRAPPRAIRPPRRRAPPRRAGGATRRRPTRAGCGRARRAIRTVSAPLTPQPTTATEAPSLRPSSSAASTAAAAVRRAVTAAASRTASSWPVSAFERTTSPVTVGQAERGVAGERRDPLEQRVAAADRGHRPEVARRVVRHVDLRRHRPLAAVVSDERVLDCRIRVLRRDRVEHRCAREDRDRHRRPSRSPRAARSGRPARRRRRPRRTTGRVCGGSHRTTAAPSGRHGVTDPTAVRAGMPSSSA